MKQFVNLITLYRLVASFFLLALLFLGEFDLFKWGLAISFMTDAIDGSLARRFRVASTTGARLDSVADEATVLVAIIGLYVYHAEFFSRHMFVITVLVTLYLTQNVLAFMVYGKMTSFHTVMAKAAAVAQGVFFIMMFFGFPHAELVFYIACGLTAIDLLEELLITVILPDWKTDVPGIFWLVKERRVR